MNDKGLQEQLIWLRNQVLCCKQLIESSKENHLNMLYVDPNGVNVKATVSNSHAPFNDIITARDMAEPGELIEIHTGVYALEDSGTFEGNSIANYGEALNYHFMNGTDVDADQERIPGIGFGNFDFAEFAPAGTSLKITGYGKFTQSGRISPDDYGVVIGAYGGDEFYFQASEVIAEGRSFGIQVACPISYVDVTYLYSEEVRAYASVNLDPGDASTTSWKRHARFGTVEVNNTGPDIIRSFAHQPYANFTPGTIDSIVVDNVLLRGANRASTYVCDIQGPATGDGAAFNFECGTIYNTNTGHTTYADFENTSNNGVNGAEVHYTGGGADIAANTIFTARVGSIFSTNLAFAVHGFWMENSHIDIEIGKAIATDTVSFAFFNPHLADNSSLTIRGHYINQTNDQPVGILFYPNVGSDSTVYFKDCIFEHSDLTNIKSCIQISSGSASGRLVFKNCRFITNTAIAPLTTDSGVAIDIMFIDCTTNTAIRDANINVVGTLTTL